MNKSANNTSNVKYLIIFFAVFGVIILLSVIFRAFFVLQQSTFTGQEFNVALISNDTHIIHINTRDNRASILTVKGFQHKIPSMNTLGLSYELGIPLHAIIIDSQKKIARINDSFFSISNLSSIATDPQYKKIGMNAADALKVYLSYRSFIPENRSNITISAQDLEKKQGEQTNTYIYDMFKNSDIINDKVSVHIINGTDVNGMGTKFARVFENWGFNVVSITNELNLDQSVIQSDISNQNYIDRIHPIFPFVIKHNIKNSIADITVVIAEDSLKSIVNE